MTQLSTEAEDGRGGTVAARSSSADKHRYSSRRASRTGDKPAPQPDTVLEPDDLGFSPGADMWDEGRTAARSGNHERAIACFVREAEARSRQSSHGRAAIAFRTAAEQARLQGLAEHGDQLLAQAAASYIQAAKRSGLTADATNQAWISAAKCFLQLQQLDRAAWCIEQARKVDPTRRYDASVTAAT